MKRLAILFFIVAPLVGCLGKRASEQDIATALDNGRQANEALVRSERFVRGWMARRDSITGLFPRNFRGDNYWNAMDAAADNYPFMVLTSWFTDRDRFEGSMKEILNAEIRHTSRIGSLPANYDLDNHRWLEEKPDTSNIIFGSAEYMKDGLLPLAEWLGPSPWSERMFDILDDLRKMVEVVERIDGEYWGGEPVIEVNGDLLQVLSRLYWMSGQQKYLDHAIAIGDYYLLQGHNPADLRRLRLRDHGCEIVLGLCELYATLHYADPGKKEIYKPHLHRLLDRILEVGRNTHGLFYDEIDPASGTVLSEHLADTWGYTFDGYYIVYLLDGREDYREALLKLMSNLDEHYRRYDWEGNHDGYADAIESAINLYNREPIPSVVDWIDSRMQVMYEFQKSDGIIGGWHGDGNFARTAIMYALWKSRGAWINSWREDVMMGAVELSENRVLWVLTANRAWSGKLHFDIARYRYYLNLPIDWPRINQFPHWFTVEKEKTYWLRIDGGCKTGLSGEQLQKGLDITIPNTGVVTVEIRIH